MKALCRLRDFSPQRRKGAEESAEEFSEGRHKALATFRNHSCSSLCLGALVVRAVAGKDGTRERESAMPDSKVAVITGASGGIGAALAKHLGAQGHRLVLAARREPELQQVARPFGEKALVVVTDVRRRQEVERLRDQALGKFGVVDIWVNNAGRGISKAVLDLTDEDLDEMLAVNLKSALYGMQAIVPHFQQRGRGHLSNIASMLGRVPLVSFRSAYNAAKAGLIALTANLRMDLARDYPNIHISVVMPGIVTTEFAANALGGTPGWRPGSGQPEVQSAEEVAAKIADLIQHPAPELYTNPAQIDLVLRKMGCNEGGSARSHARGIVDREYKSDSVVRTSKSADGSTSACPEADFCGHSGSTSRRLLYQGVYYTASSVAWDSPSVARKILACHRHSRLGTALGLSSP